MMSKYTKNSLIATILDLIASVEKTGNESIEFIGQGAYANGAFLEGQTTGTWSSTAARPTSDLEKGFEAGFILEDEIHAEEVEGLDKLKTLPSDVYEMFDSEYDSMYIQYAGGSALTALVAASINPLRTAFAGKIDDPDKAEAIFPKIKNALSANDVNTSINPNAHDLAFAEAEMFLRSFHGSPKHNSLFYEDFENKGEKKYAELLLFRPFTKAGNATLIRLNAMEGTALPTAVRRFGPLGSYPRGKKAMLAQVWPTGEHATATLFNWTAAAFAGDTKRIGCKENTLTETERKELQTDLMFMLGEMSGSSAYYSLVLSCNKPMSPINFKSLQGIGNFSTWKAGNFFSNAFHPKTVLRALARGWCKLMKALGMPGPDLSDLGAIDSVNEHMKSLAKFATGRAKLPALDSADPFTLNESALLSSDPSRKAHKEYWENLGRALVWSAGKVPDPVVEDRELSGAEARALLAFYTQLLPTTNDYIVSPILALRVKDYTENNYHISPQLILSAHNDVVAVESEHFTWDADSHKLKCSIKNQLDNKIKPLVTGTRM